jgi:hypothetical protein
MLITCLALGGVILLQACTMGGGSDPPLKSDPTSLSFNGIETKNVTITWGGFSKVVVSHQTITGPNASSFELIGGASCEGQTNGVYWGGRTSCTESVKLKSSTKGLNATLVAVNQYGDLEIPLGS